jgi:hypothetical protein
MKSTLVVISHYNAWPNDQLVALLDQLKSIPAGSPFDCRVVVNQAIDRPLDLPTRHQDVDVRYRENTGYNIGAWDHGWRVDPPYETYLFLQEECRILRTGWLQGYLKCLSDPKVGMVGESMFWPGYTWERADTYSLYSTFPGTPAEGPNVTHTEGIRAFLGSQGIPIGKTAEHLQSLVLCTRRGVLEATDGFLVGRDYGEAIGSEVAISKRVEALGLRVREVGIGPFRYILHPQWANLRATPSRVLFTWLEPHIPISLALEMRKPARYLRELFTGRK